MNHSRQNNFLYLVMFVTILLYLASSNTMAESLQHPRLLWNQTWQDQWEQAKNSNNVWWLRVKEYADYAVKYGGVYQDGGIYPSIAYQVTKDPKYALAAYNIFMKYPADVPSTQRFIGHFAIQIILAYDWMYNGLTPEQKQNAMDRVIEIGEIFTKPDCKNNAWCLLRIGRPEGWYVADSDETAFMYFYLALLEQVIEGESAKAGTFLNASPIDIYGITLPIGGLDYSGTGGMPPAVSSTLRDVIYHYGVSSSGGSWIESSEYNKSTFRSVLLSYQALKQITGQDHFPEYARIMPDSAEFVFHEITPDMEQSYDWNDNEEPRSMNVKWKRQLMGWVNCMMALARINRDIDIGANLNQLIEELRVKYPTSAYVPLTGTGLMAYYPMDPKKDWRSTLSKGFLAVGMGLFRYKTGWNNDDSLFGAQMTTRINVDHSVEYQGFSAPQGIHGYFGHFQLYRKGKWAITAPEGYGNQTASMRNAMEIGGIPTMWELGPIANEWTDHYAYVAGLTQKTPDHPGAWNRRPDSFCNEWTRSIFYLPTNDKSADSIVIYDRVSSAETKAWFFHTQEPAAFQGNIATWDITDINSLPQPALATSGTQKAQLTILSPQNVKTSIYPDPPGNTLESELKYTFKVVPSDSNVWDTFLNVVDVYDQGTAPVVTKISSISGSQDLAEGVKLTRSGQSDVVVLFGANPFPSDRILSNGYSVAFDSSNNKTEIYFADLSKTKGWLVKVDDNAFVQLVINNKGIGTGIGNVTVTGTGSHNISLISTETSLSSSCKVTITPKEAIEGGAKWQIDGGAWQDSDVTISDLTVGTHTIAFKLIYGWITPATQTLTIAKDQTVMTSGIYIGKSGSLSVTISPESVISLGAEWNVDGGIWQSGDATISDLSIGVHTVEFKAIDSWTTPKSQTVTIQSGQMTRTKGTYTAAYMSHAPEEMISVLKILCDISVPKIDMNNDIDLDRKLELEDAIKILQIGSGQYEKTLTNALGMVFNFIPAGTFIMGSPTSEPGRLTNETQHTVTLTKSFYIMTTEVTQGQWKALMSSNPSYYTSCGDDCPVEQVGFNAIQTFIAALSKSDGRLYRLPTEAEWEYAARAGSTTALPNGDLIPANCNTPDPNLIKIGWYCGNSDRVTHPVAQKEANNLGLYDMIGNIWEWTQDYLSNYPDYAIIDPVGPDTGVSRIARGGSFMTDGKNCRTAYRGVFPDIQSGMLGFRLVCNP